MLRRLMVVGSMVVLGTTAVFASTGARAARERRESNVVRTVATPVVMPARENAAPISQPVAETHSILHETTFEFDRAHRGRAHNVALAASRLDGAVIGAGESFSFNDRVGPRTRSAGFAGAPEIHDGELVQGVGGGVCQVATTLHIASLRSGLVVLERRNHSLPSHYADPGLDATVVYGRVDLKLSNPHSFPVRIHAMTNEGVLRVWIESDEPIAPYEIERRVLRRIPADTVTVNDPSLATGEQRVQRRGRPGVIVRVRAVRGEEMQNEQTLRYDPEPRIVQVGNAA